MQIRSRLTLQFIVIVAVILLVALLFIHFEFSIKVKDDFYGNLKSKAIMTADMIVRSNIQNFNEERDLYQKGNYPKYTENIIIYDEHYQRVYSFNPSPDDISITTLQEIRRLKELRFSRPPFSALGLVYEDKQNNVHLIIAEAIFKSESLQYLDRILIIVFFILIAFVAIGGWIFAGQALSPVNQIMNQVDGLLPSNMNERVKIKNQHDEMSRLVDTFNKLLNRIQNAFSTQKMFLSNVSHELKNPLSVMKSQIEVTLQKRRTEQEYVDTFKSVLDDIENLDDVTNKLMQLANITSENAQIHFTPLRVDELFWQARTALLKNHSEYKVHLESVHLPEDENSLVIQGNEALLKTALINVMDNACKFSADKQAIIRISSDNASRIFLEIQDKGPGILKEDLPYIFEPFYRSPKMSGVKGSGIGLSLVKHIFKLHEVEMDVLAPSGGGTLFRLKFVSKPLKTQNV